MVIILTGLEANSDDSSNALLHQAIQANDLEQVKQLLNAGADPNVGDRNGHSPLERAVEAGNCDIVQALVQAGANLDYGLLTFPLVRAVLDGRVDCVEVLVQAGANVNLKLEDGETALMSAAAEGNIDIVKILVEAGAIVDITSEQGDSAISLAATNGWQDVFDYLAPKVSAKARRQAEKELAVGLRRQRKQVEILFSAAAAGNLEEVQSALSAGADVDGIGVKGGTALHIASHWGHTHIVKALIAAGANLELYDESPGWTPLLTAINMGKTASVYLLLKAGADPNAPSRDGEDTPLIMAASAFMAGPEIVRDLVAAGADLEAKNRFGCTALMTAVYVDARSKMFSSEDIIQALRVAGASETGLDEIALVLAVGCGNQQQIESLIAAGVNVNARTPSGKTSLTLAAKQGHFEIAQILIQAGADVNLVSDFSPLIWAVIKRHTEIVQLLLEAGADVLLKTDTGVTAMMHAKSKYTSPEIISILKEAKKAQQLTQKRSKGKKLTS